MKTLFKVIVLATLTACAVEDEHKSSFGMPPDHNLEFPCIWNGHNYCDAAKINAWAICLRRIKCDGSTESAQACAVRLTGQFCEIYDCTAEYEDWTRFTPCVNDYQNASCLAMPMVCTL